VTVQLVYRVDVTSTETRVRPNGEIDILVADELADVLSTSLSEGDGRVVVDMADVELLDSSGVRALLRAYKVATANHRPLAVENCAPIVHRVLTISGVADLMPTTTRDPAEGGSQA
jgi:anti-sigma B factor antagonist